MDRKNITLRQLKAIAELILETHYNIKAKIDLTVSTLLPDQIKANVQGIGRYDIIINGDIPTEKWPKIIAHELAHIITGSEWHDDIHKNIMDKIENLILEEIKNK